MASHLYQSYDMDILSLRTIVQLQLENIDEVIAYSRGKRRQTKDSDPALAPQGNVDDAATPDDHPYDRMLAQDLSNSEPKDMSVAWEAEQQHKIVAPDTALVHSGAPDEPVPSHSQSTGSEVMIDQSDPLRDLWPVLLEPDLDQLIAAASPARSSPRRVRFDTAKVQCVACVEEKDLDDVVRVSCEDRHAYCRECLERLFRLSMSDKSLFPPRCDGAEITLQQAHSFLPPSLVTQFESKSTELRTKNPTYCHDTACSTFIPLSPLDGTVGTCPKCTKVTCTKCKAAWHLGHCRGDRAPRESKETKDTERWQKCYKCSGLIVLERGCNHITYVYVANGEDRIQAHSGIQLSMRRRVLLYLRIEVEDLCLRSYGTKSNKGPRSSESPF